MTNIESVPSLVAGYHDWLRQKTMIKDLHEGWTEITTPFLDRHNDHIQILVRHRDGGIELTDDGETIRDLEMSGCSMDSAKRQTLLRTTLNGFGVSVENNVLRSRATSQNFAFKKHNLIQAIIAVNDIFFVSQSNIVSFFRDEVEEWLSQSNVRAVADVNFLGKSGFQHRFDFAVPRSAAAPERLIRTINKPNKDSAVSMIMAWTDTQDQRPPDSKAIAILNDNEQSVPATVIDALNEYAILGITWSTRNKTLETLAA